MLGVGPRIDFKTWKKILYFWLCWIFVAAGGLSLVAEGGGFSSLQRVGASLHCRVWGLLALVSSLLAGHRLWAHKLQ